jgi:hypothetical protein
LIGNDTLSFGNSKATDAIGFYILTAGLETTYNITIRTGDGQEYFFPLVGDPNPSFRGFVAAKRITSVVITNEGPISELNYSFDNVSRGAIQTIPEPSSLLLFASSFTVAIAINRRYNHSRKLRQ